MTDTMIGADIRPPIYPTRKTNGKNKRIENGLVGRNYKVAGGLRTINGSHPFIGLAVEDRPIVRSTNWSLIQNTSLPEIADRPTVKLNASVQTDCEESRIIGWYMRLKRDILKSIRNRVTPSR
uniref:Uncharacterized protein n=1 Tax=Bracon brevicornis TaxID=1563983 RepID=A0A6V7HU15_9HYME